MERLNMYKLSFTVGGIIKMYKILKELGLIDSDGVNNIDGGIFCGINTDNERGLVELIMHDTQQIDGSRVGEIGEVPTRGGIYFAQDIKSPEHIKSSAFDSELLNRLVDDNG